MTACKLSRPPTFFRSAFDIELSVVQSVTLYTLFRAVRTNRPPAAFGTFKEKVVLGHELFPCWGNSIALKKIGIGLLLYPLVRLIWKFVVRCEGLLLCPMRRTALVPPKNRD